MPHALWYTDIFGLEIYNRMQRLSSCAVASITPNDAIRPG